MTDSPDTHPIPVFDSPHAPFIFFDAAPAFAFSHGVIGITLSANRTTTSTSAAINEQIVTAYLRGNVHAAISLRNALNQALLVAVPAASDKAS